MVILSCLAKKNQNVIARKKSSVYSCLSKVRGCFWLENATFSNRLIFFSSDSNFDFSSETTQNDHNRLLYKFKNDQKMFGCVGSCGYAAASANRNSDKRHHVDYFY